MKKVFDSNLHWDIIKRGKYFALAVKKHLPQIHVIRLRLHQYRLWQRKQECSIRMRLNRFLRN